MEQRSKEWFEVRRGKFTASEIHKLMGKTFGENITDWTQTAQTYILEKVSEHFAEPIEERTSTACQWGIEHEEIARTYYESIFKEDVKLVGFKAFGEHAGCSPDGIVKGKKRGIEIKCPYTIVQHLKNLRIKNNADLKANNPEYYWQIQFSMVCFGFDRWDYVSYHPNFEPKTRLNCIEIVKNENDCATLIERIEMATKIKLQIISELC
jgi:putative phage-type endonuclease